MASVSSLPSVSYDLSSVHPGHVVKRPMAPSLTDMCLGIIASEFGNRASLRGIPPRLIDRFTEMLPTSLPLDVAAHLISDERFWKKAASNIWKVCETSLHGSSWKRLFFEKKMADFLETFDPAKQSLEDLDKMFNNAKDYVFSLRLSQSRAHLDLEMLFQNIPTLNCLELTYGVKNIGMDFERELFGMNPSDVLSLANALKVTETLTVLSLPNNLLNDSSTRILATGLQENFTITSLDLSHNKISDRGVKAITKSLGENSVLTNLNLSDNRIHIDGGRYIGRALKGNSALENLNLRLNRLCDDGGRMLIEGLLENSTLKHLNLSCNSLEIGATRAVCKVLESNSTLRSLDMSANLLSDESAMLMLESMQGNEVLTSIDIRFNQVLEDVEASMVELCRNNAEKLRVAELHGALDIYH